MQCLDRICRRFLLRFILVVFDGFDTEIRLGIVCVFDNARYRGRRLDDVGFEWRVGWVVSFGYLISGLG